jgi:hypothetical protein
VKRWASQNAVSIIGGRLKYIWLYLSIVLLGGCASSPNILPNAATDTVTLSRGNYKMVKAGARGVSTGFVLLAIPFGSPTYAEAKSNLYNSLGQKLEGRSIAMVNQTSDTGGAWFVLVAFPSITITADVIEFTDR